MAEQPNQAQRQKYCLNCGRLISPNHRNFEERKYCSKYCSGNRLSSVDFELESRIRALATEHTSISCDEAQQKCQDLRDDGNAATEDKQQAGMEEAKWRERVRRAARRVVTQPQGEVIFESIQYGKLVEPSYAKGNWSVRVIK